MTQYLGRVLFWCGVWEVIYIYGVEGWTYADFPRVLPLSLCEERHVLARKIFAIFTSSKGTNASNLSEYVLAFNLLIVRERAKERVARNKWYCKKRKIFSTKTLILIRKHQKQIDRHIYHKNKNTTIITKWFQYYMYMRLTSTCTCFSKIREISPRVLSSPDALLLAHCPLSWPCSCFSRSFTKRCNLNTWERRNFFNRFAEIRVSYQCFSTTRRSKSKCKKI